MLSRVTSWLRSWGKNRSEAAIFERDVRVSVSDHGLASAYRTGAAQSIAWSDVQRILVKTNDSGPWGADVWWVLEGTTSKCEFPQGATGEDAALAEIRRRFPSFEVKGMNSVTNATFVCWEKGHAL
jgi:hypothetical protein